MKRVDLLDDFRQQMLISLKAYWRNEMAQLKPKALQARDLFPMINEINVMLVTGEND